MQKKMTRLLAAGMLLVVAQPIIAQPIAAPTQPNADAANPEWDIDALMRRGISPALLENLDKQNQLPPGNQVIDIRMNGKFSGAYAVTVTPQGTLCFTPELLEALDMPVPEAAHTASCYDWAAQSADISLVWQPETLTLSIVVPPRWQRASVLQGESGGSAAISNYSYFSSVNRSGQQRSRYSWLALNSGVNVHNWILRSRQNIQQNQGKWTSSFDSTWLERAVPAWKKVVQAGEIDVQNTLFALRTLNGLQLTPDEGIDARDAGSGVSVSGVANTPQARVEVRQYGQLVYSSLVPAGAFRLDNIPLQNRNADLAVTVVETDGHQQQFRVPALQFASQYPQRAAGFSVAMGNIKSDGAPGDRPPLFTLNQHWLPWQDYGLNSGLLLTPRYHALALALNATPQPRLMLAINSTLEHNRYQANNGARLQAYAGYSLADDLSLGLGAAKNSPGYTQLEEARQGDNRFSEVTDRELNLSLSWSPAWLGSLSLNASRSRSYHDRQTWRYHMLSWNRRFRNNVTLTLTASGSSGGGNGNKNLSLSLSWPLGEQRIRHYYRDYQQSSLLGSEISGPLGRDNTYQLAVEQQRQQQVRSLQGMLNSDLHYTRLSLNARRDSQQQSSYSINGAGGLVLQRAGVAFSNTPVRETFGLLQLSQPLSGIEVTSPGGNSWTDWRGRAVLPALPPWRESALDVDVARLPHNVEIGNGHRTLRLARGTVKTVQMTVLSSRRVLLTIYLADGQRLPKGSTLWQGDRLVAEAVDDGVVFLPDAANDATFHVKAAQTNAECDIHYQLKEPESEQTPFEKLTLHCT